MELNNIELKNVSRFLELYCNEILGENNEFSSDAIETGEFYNAMISILWELLRDNKINPISANDFENKYLCLKDKSFNDFRKEKFNIITVYDEFKKLIGH